MCVCSSDGHVSDRCSDARPACITHSMGTDPVWLLVHMCVADIMHVGSMLSQGVACPAQPADPRRVLHMHSICNQTAVVHVSTVNNLGFNPNCTLLATTPPQLDLWILQNGTKAHRALSAPSGGTRVLVTALGTPLPAAAPAGRCGSCACGGLPACLGGAPGAQSCCSRPPAPPPGDGLADAVGA